MGMAKNKKDQVDSFSGIFGQGQKIESNIIIQKETSSKGRPKVERETKERKSIAILPSLYETIGKIAYVERTSISEIIAQCLEEYADRNFDKVQEYDRIKKKK